MTLPDVAPPVERAVEPLRAGLPELVCALSHALDAAEGREPGHALRVAYVCQQLTSELGLDRGHRRAALFAGLLHDIGVPAVTPSLVDVPHLDEESLFAFAPTNGVELADAAPAHRGIAAQALRAHPTASADFLGRSWFPEATMPAVRGHHENWDGSGYPDGLAGDAIPILARVLRAADLFESVVASEGNPLSARAGVTAAARAWSGREIQPEIGAALACIARDDHFWLAFHDERIDAALTAMAPTNGLRPSGKLLAGFSEAVATLVDARARHEPGRAMQVATLVRAMAEAVEISPQEVARLGLATLWADIGVMAVPSRILGKPDLLTVDEMQRMRAHPGVSGEIVARIPALAEAAPWLAAHHERPDGRGYPRMLSDPEIPSEARILALADAYGAMTTRRPYREALTSPDALAVLRAGAGTQWDPFLARVLANVLEAQAS